MGVCVCVCVCDGVPLCCVCVCARAPIFYMCVCVRARAPICSVGRRVGGWTVSVLLKLAVVDISLFTGVFLLLLFLLFIDRLTPLATTVFCLSCNGQCAAMEKEQTEE